MAKKNKKSSPSGAVAKTTSAPAARGTKTTKQTPPKVMYANDGSCIIHHHEYVGDIDGLGGEARITYPCNPQSPETFTWLSALATRFEMFRFKKLKFHYRPSCSTNNEGYVVLGFDFDAYDEFPTKVVMLAWKYSAKGAVWQSVDLDCTADSRLSTFRYCGSGESGDRRLDLLGNLFVLAQSSATLSLGEIFVTYECEFRQPAYRLPPALSARLRRPPAIPFMPGFNTWWDGIIQNVTTFGNIALELLTSNQLLIKTPGKYLLELLVNATSGLTGTPTVTYTVPVASPSSKFEVQQLNSFTSATKAQYSSYLEVQTAPVLLTFGGLSGGSDLKPQLFMGTYFSGYL